MTYQEEIDIQLQYENDPFSFEKETDAWFEEQSKKLDAWNKRYEELKKSQNEGE